MTTTSLEALREKAKRAEEEAGQAKATLLRAAVAEAVTSTAYGHLSAVAHRAGIAVQYLRKLVEAEHPGWIERARQERDAAKSRSAKGS
ncbi:hypothetical protein OG897_40745 [Streptomyces sp. NBC_00237]|uniref:hypothetical protein n=1 Tax=Streptomyces sp. NBC_00237 TaxID=2975687 RepID=UPI002258C04B|nr:hypothetical protein [Streptomyces sp. NBC_00237]MCX5207714.1 hypothetical protein [Streptomyces sp. NBC_00237]